MAPYTIKVEPNGTRNTHHLKLRKGADEVGIILCDAQGKRDPKGLQRNSYPRSALKTYSGEEDYADTEPPFRPISQQDWSGGRGQLVFERDTRRFYDSWRADTRHTGKIFLGGQETYCSGDYRKLNQFTGFATMVWVPVMATYKYVASEFTTPAGGYTIGRLECEIKKVGAGGGDLEMEVWSDAPGNPSAIVHANAHATITAASVTDVLSILISLPPAGAVPALAAATKYWFVVRDTGTPTTDDHWEVGASQAAPLHSADGITWNGTTSALYFRVLDNTADLFGRMLEYKRAVYLVTQPESGNSKLYINGTRGVAGDNAANKDRLNDATKAAAADWHCQEGAIVLVINGPGSEELQAWRTVTSVNAGYLEVTPNWNVTHTTATEYVILGSDDWDYLADLGAYVTDAVVTDNFIYFARGENYGVYRYQWYNNGGAAAERTASEVSAAQYLTTTQHPVLGTVIWGSRSDSSFFYGPSVWKGRVPYAWGEPYHSFGQILTTEEPFDDWQVGNVTPRVYFDSTSIQIAAGFGTGVAAVKNLPAPFDLTRGGYIGVMSYSSVNTNAGDLQLLLDDQENLGKAYSPTGLKYTGGGFTDWNEAKDGDAATAVTPAAWVATDYVYVGFTKPFGKVSVDMGGTVNAVASVLTVQYFNGSAWVAVSGLSDGTDNAGATFGKDGDITFTIPQDWEESVVDSGADALEAYWVRFKVSVNLTASIVINEVTVTRKNNITLDLPAHTAGVWQWSVMAITPLQYPYADDTQIRSIGLKVAVDNGEQDVRFYGGFQLLKQGLTYIDLPNDARILALESYGGGETDRKRNPWVITEKEFGEIQTDPDTDVDIYVPVVLDELAGLRSLTNGRAHAVGGKYLWFNVGERVERYFNELLEDVGPTLDEGLPENRRGTPVRLRSYPGEMLLVIDGGASNYSSILTHTNGGWHEVYRSHRAGARIYDAMVQAIPGQVDRLWICQAGDILWVPIDVNPLSESGYRYTHEAVVHSSRVHGGMQDVLKFWKSLKLVSTNLGSNGCQVWGDFRLEGETTCTTLPSVFDTSIFQEIDLTNDYSAAGRYIEIRVRLQTGDARYTPVINGWVIESLMRYEVKWVYSLNFRLANHDTDLMGGHEPVSMADKRAILDTWLASPTPIFVEAFRDDLDGAVAYLEPVPLRPLRTVVDPEDTDKSRLVDIAQMTLIGI